MNKFRYYTAGESHGPGLIGILEGVPAGLEISEEDIFLDLQRRQMGHGRGGRMRIEKDFARIFSGIRFGKTLGSPISMLIENKDWKNWETKMSIGKVDVDIQQVRIPRPGHADFAGSIKYGHKDIRSILERASARETAMRVALGAVARKFLTEFGIVVVSHVVQIHKAQSDFSVAHLGSNDTPEFPLEQMSALADESSVRCLNKEIERKMIAAIDTAKAQKDTLGGVFEVVAFGLPIGLGSHVHWDRKLDGRIGGAMMSIPGMKGVEIGIGFVSGTLTGSKVHDAIYYDDSEAQYFRSRNHAGGLEGGISNGMPLVVRVAMKPIATLMNPLDSVNMETKKATVAHIERSDVCAVPAASVIGESVLCLVLADAFLEKFGGDSIEEIRERHDAWKRQSVK